MQNTEVELLSDCIIIVGLYKLVKIQFPLSITMQNKQRKTKQVVIK